ncbi:MAG: hypothetical protein ABI295_11200 [Xanthomarina sp.]
MKAFKFNKIYVIESLNEKEDKLTGKELYNDLLRWKEYQIKDFKSELIQVASKKEFFEKMKLIKVECINKGQFPIIHFEIHGSQDKTGLVLNSGELIKWSELYEDLVQMNSIIGNNLFITLAVRHGVYLMKLIKIDKPSPFWGFIGSFNTIEELDLMISYNGFYDEFLKNFDLDAAIKRLQESNYDIPSSYRIITSELVFKDVIHRCFQKKYTQKKMFKRFETVLKSRNITIQNRNEKHNNAQKFRIEFHKLKRQYFENSKKTFFMFHYFPSNSERFKIGYNEVNN